MKIGVFGSSGMVGRHLYKFFTNRESNAEVYGYDLKDTHHTLEEALSADILFLCLPTPYITGEKGYYISALAETLGKIPDGKIVIIKSTIVPGTTDFFQKTYPNLKIMFCPEFLTEKTAWEDTIHPDTSIIGTTDQSYKYARQVLDILPEAPSEFIMTAKEAEIVKLARNNYFVNKIVFMNALFDLCKSVNVDYENIKEALASDRRVRRSHMEIHHNGARGGGGTCFPKDSHAFLDWAEGLDERAHRFIKHYVEFNDSLLDESGKSRGKQYL